MRKVWLVALLAIASSLIIVAADWPMPTGSPQRNGWARSERLLNKGNIANLKLLYKFQAENISRGPNSLTPPIVNGNLITYRGFKEMLMFGASSDKVFSVDADLNHVLWQSHLEYVADKPPSQTVTAVCPGGLTSPIAMAGSSSAAMHFAAAASRTPAVAGGRPKRPSPYFPPLSQSVYPMTPTTLTQLAALYTVSSDGKLHVLNSSTGENLIAPIQYLPPNAKVTSLNIWDNVVYATTAGNCDGYQNALYAVDLLSNAKKVALFVPQRGGFAGIAGTAIGNNGTVYAQVMYMPGAAPDSAPRDTVVALNPKDLQVKDYFTPPDDAGEKKDDSGPGITPLVFSSMGRDLLLAGGRNGRLYLLDSKSLGGPNHSTPLLETDPIAHRTKNYDGRGFRGAFSTWWDVDTETRWIYAPVAGAPVSSFQLSKKDNVPADGSIVALKLTQASGRPDLQPLWISRNIASPAPVVIANRMVFALSTGESSRVAQKDGAPYSVSEWNEMAGKATLYVLDAMNGKELYSSGDTVSSFSHAGGVAVANGRVYFGAHNNAVYCFGFKGEQLQLTEQ